jgi:hypothetical protein
MNDLMKLTNAVNGIPVALNPRHVVAIEPTRSTRYPDARCHITTALNSDGATGCLVKEEYQDVYDLFCIAL